VLHQAGYGRGVELMLERVTAVSKSAYATRGERPLVHEHKASLRVRADLLAAEQIMLQESMTAQRQSRATVASSRMCGGADG